MYKLSHLLQDLPTLHESRMVGKGYAVWMVWSSELSGAILKTFQDYGGMEISTGPNQSFWYFFTKDVFGAVARLQVWSNLNPIPVSIQVFEADLLIGFQQEKSISIASELYAQQAMPPDDFQVLVHPTARPIVDGTPGIQLDKMERQPTGIASASWSLLKGDPRIGVQSSMGWYFIIKGLGNPLDKAYMEGWHNYFAELEVLLKRQKLKYIINQGTLIFNLETFTALRTWTSELLSLLRKIKEDDERAYWPSVMAAVERSGYQFNEELPNKINLDWDQMAPDFPHMTYRAAFMLGERFTIKDVSYSFERSRLTDWCYVHLAGLDDEEEQGSLAVTLPIALLAGTERPCFYCGLRSHTEPDCPTRAFKPSESNVWRNIAVMDLEDLNKDMFALGEKVKVDPIETLPAVVGEESAPGFILNAVFEINAPSQIRTMPLVWRSMGKELPSGLTKLKPFEKSPLTEALSQFMAGDLQTAEKMVREGAMRGPRDFQFRTLQGFIALEQGSPERAGRAWREAEPLGDNPLHFAYHKYLQARALEVEGKFDAAVSMYKETAKLCPKWLEARYRQGVCMVKMGFSDHAVSLLDDLVDEDPNIFNRILIDPEVERGYVQILGSLWTRWMAAHTGAQQATEQLQNLSSEIGDWFGQEHEFRKQAQRQIGILLELGETDNYVAFNRLVSGRMRIATELKKKIRGEVKGIQRQAENFRARLLHINDEIAWFPFPRVLHEFNKEFNYCVTKLNWVKQQHFKVARNFRKSNEFFQEVEKKLDNLDSRLFTLRIVRDSTLFSLILSKSFMWMEIVGLGIALITIPLGAYIGETQNLEWLSSALENDRWGVQKGLVVIVSVLALVLSSLHTALVFDKKKEKFFEERRKLTGKGKQGAGKKGKK